MLPDAVGAGPMALKVEPIFAMKPDPHYPKTGTNLRRLRGKAGITQENLAQKVGVTTHTIWRLENDRAANPHLKTSTGVGQTLESHNVPAPGRLGRLPMADRVRSHHSLVRCPYYGFL